MSTYEQITSSDNSHYLHHTFFEPTVSDSEPDSVKTVRATLLIVHGMAEHSGRYASFAQFLADNGIAVVTYDQLGHGQTIKSPDELGFFGSEHPMQSLLKDVIIMADSIKSRYPDVPHFIMGHSMGSFIVLTVLKHHAHNFAGAILMGTADANPLIKVLLPINKILAKAAAKKPNSVFSDLMNKLLNSKLATDSSSEFAWLSESKANIAAYEADPLAGFVFTNNGFYTLFALMQAGLDKGWARTITKDFPMLFISGKDDPIGNMGRGIRAIDNRLQKQGFANISTKLYPNMRHEPLHEQDSNLVYDDILHWIDDLSI